MIGLVKTPIRLPARGPVVWRSTRATASTQVGEAGSAPPRRQLASSRRMVSMLMSRT
ncbi:hypothetical protein D3C80_2190930 [compost metagenome]